MDRGGDVGRMGEIGDRFRIAFASIISDPSEAKIRLESVPAGGSKRGSDNELQR